MIVITNNLVQKRSKSNDQ